MKQELVWIVGAGLLCASATAFADGDPDPSAGATSPAATAPAGATAVGNGGVWGTAINDRPLVLDPGKFEIHAQLPIYDGGGDTAEALNLGISYGLLPKLELGVDYFMLLNPDGGPSNSELSLRAAYSALHTDKMDLAISVALDLSFIGDTRAALALGAWFRYRITPKVSLFTGLPATPPSQDIAFGIPQNQLFIGFGDNQAVSLGLPIGVGFQATPQVYLFAATEIAEFTFTPNSGADFIFADNIPLTVGGFFSVNPSVDLGVSFSDDLEHAGDFYTFTFAGRYFIK